MEMNRNTQAALRLLEAAERLAYLATGPATAARMTLRSATGEYLGEVVVSVRAAAHLADAIEAVGAYAESRPDDFAKGGQQPSADNSTAAPEPAFVVPEDSELHPESTAELIDMFDELDLVALTKTVLNAAAPTDRLAATKAIDDVFGHIPHPGVEDGDL